MNRLSSFTARTFEELYQGVKAIAWEDIIPQDGQFPVKSGQGGVVLLAHPQLHAFQHAQRRIGAEDHIAERRGVDIILQGSDPPSFI